MAKEYLMSIDIFSNPKVVDGSKADALKILRLIMMMPGSDPLHPDMGVGIRNYRFSSLKGQKGLDQLSDRTTDQVYKFLPQLQHASVEYTVTTDKILSIEIIIDDEIFIYDYEENISLESLSL